MPLCPSHRAGCVKDYSSTSLLLDLSSAASLALCLDYVCPGTDRAAFLRMPFIVVSTPMHRFGHWELVLLLGAVGVYKPLRYAESNIDLNVVK